ncbi:SDR family oxidoreductase [Herbaspirillum sp. RTI4]|uniref:SDR family NAD(P)-dependent oxidoreductase n=1 Tax=Herbaspirillum sp. RTI4 TaxID=3048640 RepID=UPI002AB35E7C|nr:SDR family oxidoreductase [Herbaspirillum sp. RTI4]MDY7577043.1 SDR family oxidoreductase [Herbaspirillum sp. RTI4]MEA9982223.1 SDR family oxidoreductase [Herbaspirillum sp. RTI4]
MNCQNKTVLVTGATSGIGHACVERFIAAGAHVVAVGRNPERLAELSASYGAQCTVISYDLGDPDKLTELVSQLPALDGLVMSAGITKSNPIKFFNRKVFDETLAINLITPVVLAVEITNAKKLRNNGSIVFLSSTNGTAGGVKGSLAYATTKAALVGASKVLAAELSGKGIRVNCVAPATISSEMVLNYFSQLSEEAMQADMQKYPLGKRYGKPSEVADLIAYLISDSSSFITGQTITIDGGRSL